MSEIVIDLEDDPVPIVKIIAAQFRRSMHHPKFVRAARSLNGAFALASTVDPQALTIRGKGGRIRIEHGVADDAGLVIRLDFNKPDDKPAIDGLWRHPLLALKADKLMASYDGTWMEAATRFWDKAHDFPRMPCAIRVLCSDEKRELVLGTGEPQVVLEGTAANLTTILSGGTVFVLAVMENKVRVDGTMEHLTVLSEVTKDMMLGSL